MVNNLPDAGVTATAIATSLQQDVPGAVLAVTDGLQSAVLLDPTHLVEAATYLRDTPGMEFDLLSSVTGVDWWDQFEVVYHLRSTKYRHLAALKVRVPRENPVVPSVVPVWTGANLQEREVFDLMGIVFEGHPYLVRVLLPEDWEGHPLRKDYYHAGGLT